MEADYTAGKKLCTPVLLPDELYQILHGLYDLCHGEIVQNLLAVLDDLAYLIIVNYTIPQTSGITT